MISLNSGAPQAFDARQKLGRRLSSHQAAAMTTRDTAEMARRVLATLGGQG